MLHHQSKFLLLHTFFTKKILPKNTNGQIVYIYTGQKKFFAWSYLRKNGQIDTVDTIWRIISGSG